MLTNEATLTILGLGPGDPALLTEAASTHLRGLERLILRTTIHPTVASLPAHLQIESFDVLYEQAGSFEEIYEQIAERLLQRVRAGESVTYAVPGHPLVAEATTRRLLAVAKAERLPTRIIAGLSFIEPVCEMLGLDPFEHGLQLLDALELIPPHDAPWNGDDAWIDTQGGEGYEPPVVPFPLVPTRPALLSQVYNRRIASEVKLTLQQRYPDSHSVTIVWSAGSLDDSRTRTVPLSELDHQSELDHLTSVYLPALPALEDLRGIDGASWVIARLLGPGGCPWDREQTHQSLRPFLLEETHEVLEALDAGDMMAVGEELGDVLLQILLHSEMARQAGLFDFGDVLSELTSKLIRRHPHVFGAVQVGGTSEVLRNWERIKRDEQAARGARPKGLLDGIPSGLPALAAAQKIGERAARVGFDWPDIEGVWSKVHEESDELRAAPAEEREEEFGDLLFVLVRLASWMKLDAETALRAASAKFRRRFAVVQELAGERRLEELNAAELDQLWNSAKGYQ